MKPQDLKEFPLISTDKLRYGDTDRQGHVNNAVFMTFLETGRVEVLHTPDNPLYDDNAEFVLVSLNLDLQGEIRWPGEGGAHITSESGVILAHLNGLAKAKVFEMQETQFAEKTTLYISGITLDDTYELIAANAPPGSPSVKHDNETFPIAQVEIGQKKSGLLKYP